MFYAFWILLSVLQEVLTPVCTHMPYSVTLDTNSYDNNVYLIPWFACDSFDSKQAVITAVITVVHN